MQDTYAHMALEIKGIPHCLMEMKLRSHPKKIKVKKLCNFATQNGIQFNSIYNNNNKDPTIILNNTQ